MSNDSYGVPYVKGSDGSKAAADAMRPYAGSQEDWMQAVHVGRARGLHLDELKALWPFGDGSEKHSSITRARKKAKDANLIHAIKRGDPGFDADRHTRQNKHGIRIEVTFHGPKKPQGELF